MFALRVHNSKTRFTRQILNKEHRLGERQPKQSLNQAQPVFDECQISMVQVKHKTWIQNENENKKKKQAVYSLWGQ